MADRKVSVMHHTVYIYMYVHGLHTALNQKRNVTSTIVEHVHSFHMQKVDVRLVELCRMIKKGQQNQTFHVLFSALVCIIFSCFFISFGMPQQNSWGILQQNSKGFCLQAFCFTRCYRAAPILKERQSFSTSSILT